MAADGLTHRPQESLFFSGTAFAGYPRFDAILSQGPTAGIGAAPGVVAIGFVAMWSVLSSSLCALALTIAKPLFVADEVELPTAKVKGKLVNLIVAFTTLERWCFQTVLKRRAGTVARDMTHPLDQPRLDQTTPPSHPVVAAH